MPTWNSVLANMANVAKYVDDTRIQAQGTALTDLAAIQANASLDTPYLASGQAAVATSRARNASLMSDGPAHIGPLLNQLGLINQLPASMIANQGTLLAQLRSYMVTNALAFRSRQYKRGSLGGFAAVGSPVGPVSFYPIFVDEDGFALEGGLPDVISAQVVQDTYSGLVAPGQELFSLQGLTLGDQIDLYAAGRGTGAKDTVAAISSDSSLALLLNPSFGSFAGTITVPTSITSWTVFTEATYTGVLATDIQIDQSAKGVYRAAAYEGTTPGSLMFKGLRPMAIWQRPADNSKAPPQGDPTFFALRWRADVNATAWTGTFTIYIGGKSLTVTVAGQVGWQTLVLDLATIGAASYLTKNAYLKNYQAVSTGPVSSVTGVATPGLAVFIAATPTAGGTSQLNFDDIVWAPFTVPGYKQSPLGGSTGGWGATSSWPARCAGVCCLPRSNGCTRGSRVRSGAPSARATGLRPRRRPSFRSPRGPFLPGPVWPMRTRAAAGTYRRAFTNIG